MSGGGLSIGSGGRGKSGDGCSIMLRVVQQLCRSHSAMPTQQAGSYQTRRWIEK
jgi:hypothetical protein